MFFSGITSVSYFQQKVFNVILIRTPTFIGKIMKIFYIRVPKHWPTKDRLAVQNDI